MLRGEIWWVSLREPLGSEPGYRRPALIVSTDALNQSAINTVLIAIVTSNLKLADAPGNILVKSSESGLPKDSVVNVSQIVTADKSFFSEYVGSLGEKTMLEVAAGLRLVMEL